MRIQGFNKRAYIGSEFNPTLQPRDTFKKKYGALQLTLLKIAVISTAILFAAVLINLQLIQGAYYYQLAERNRSRIKEIKPLRGIIFDRNNTALVANKPNFVLLAIPFDIYQQKFSSETIIQKLKLIDITNSELLDIKKQLSTYSYIPVILKKDIAYEEGIKLLSVIKELPGISLLETFKREYLYGESMSHILGYTSVVDDTDLKTDWFYSLSDIIGKDGIELKFETRLRGIKGKKLVEVNAFGKEDKVINYISSKKGEDIFLTVDLKIQQKLEEILKKYMEEFNIKKAASIVMNPENGEILAIISLPSFDNNLFTTKFDYKTYQSIIKNKDNPLFNRAIAGIYPPGSTFKLIIGAAVLQESIVDEKFTVLSTGGIRIGSWFFPDWAPNGHGAVNIKRALALSVNSYFYTVGGGYENIKGLGLDGIVKYAALFNVGKLTGIDLPGETVGFLPSSEWKIRQKKEKWYLGDTYHLSIGQGDVLVSPLQMALWTSFFANKGILYKPRIVNGEMEIIDKNFISSHNIEIIREGLRDAVLYGSASALNTLLVTSAGKTGSAEFSKDKKPHGWFTGFAPFKKPQIVITILMEESGGGMTAVPVARDFFSWYFNNKIFYD